MRGSKSNSELRKIVKTLQDENRDLRGLVKQYMFTIDTLKEKGVIPGAKTVLHSQK